MISNRDIGFVEHGKDAEIKIDTFNFTRYGLLHGKVVSVSRDAIIKDKPPERNRAAKQGGALAESSEPAGQELLYAARVSLDGAQMQVEDRMVNLAPGNGGDGGDQDGAAEDHRIRHVTLAEISAGEFEREVMGPSEAISQICPMWGKAVAVFRYHFDLTSFPISKPRPGSVGVALGLLCCLPGMFPSHATPNCIPQRGPTKGAPDCARG